MPVVGIIIGIIAIMAVVRGTEHEMAQQLAGDFGQTGAWSWIAAVLILGAMGYVPALRRVSTLSLALVIVSLVLRNGRVFSQLASIIQNPPSPAQPVPLSKYKDSSSSNSSSGGGGGGSGGGGGLSMNDLSTAATVAAMFA